MNYFLMKEYNKQKYWILIHNEYDEKKETEN